MDTKRQIMMETQDIVDDLFFGEQAAYKELVDKDIKPMFNDRQDQVLVLLSLFGLKYYEMQMEQKRLKEILLAQTLMPREGETVQ